MKNILVVENKQSLIHNYHKLYGHSSFVNKILNLEIIKDPVRASKRIPRNNFDMLIVNISLHRDNISGIKLARLAYVAGKKVIVIGDSFIDRLKFYMAYPDMIFKVPYIVSPKTTPSNLYIIDHHINKLLRDISKDNTKIIFNEILRNI